MKFEKWLEDLKKEKVKASDPTSLELMCFYEIIKQLKEINQTLDSFYEHGIGVYEAKTD